MFESILNFVISSAYAVDPAAPVAAAAQGQQGGGYSFLIMFGLLFLFMYFLMWRPQSKRAKEQQNLLNSLTKGDEVVTAGGLLGRITKLTDQYITLNISSNTEIVVQRVAVVNVLPKGTLKSIE